MGFLKRNIGLWAGIAFLIGSFFALAEADVYTTPIGIYKVDLNEGLNLVSLPLIPLSKCKSECTSATSISIIDANANWDIDNIHKDHWVKIRTGSAEGKRYWITSNDATTLIVEGNPQADGLQSGDQYDIRPNLDEVIGDQLTPANYPEYADRVWAWNGVTYENAWYSDYPGYEGWRDSIGNLSRILMDADEGFWIQIRLGTVKFQFQGRVTQESRTIPVLEGLNLVGTSYPKAVSIHDANITATPANYPEYADRVWAWNGVTYENAWYSDYPGYEGWRDSIGNLSGIILNPGEGYWIQVRGDHSPFIWNYPLPYTAQ